MAGISLVRPIRSGGAGETTGLAALTWQGSDYGLYYEPETGRIHLMTINHYRQRHLAHVRAILDSSFTEEAFSAKIETYRALSEE